MAIKFGMINHLVLTEGVLGSWFFNLWPISIWNPKVRIFGPWRWVSTVFASWAHVVKPVFIHEFELVRLLNLWQQGLIHLRTKVKFIFNLLSFNSEEFIGTLNFSFYLISIGFMHGGESLIITFRNQIWPHLVTMSSDCFVSWSEVFVGIHAWI